GRETQACCSFGVRLSVSLNCPDGKYCPDTSTCCKSERGYGCCPYPHVSFIHFILT
uniref:Granulins domain-containing protein n=1 Tax=Paramormyrops kingsleyae TaxID=1676925 RepID=A0A3B3R6U9_9TELE